MVRPTEFDAEQALGSATRLFWRQGYANTSLSQLVEEMGISRSSLYAAFGDKRSLFTMAVQRYNAGYSEIVEQISSSNDPAFAMELYFSQVRLQHQGWRLGDGCLIVNSLLEFADIDVELATLARDQLKAVNIAFRQCFRQASEAGKFKTHLPPDQVADMFMILNQGIRVSQRNGLGEQDIRELLESFLALIGVGEPTVGSFIKSHNI